jgi:hypothetical protein
LKPFSQGELSGNWIGAVARQQHLRYLRKRKQDASCHFCRSSRGQPRAGTASVYSKKLQVYVKRITTLLSRQMVVGIIKKVLELGAGGDSFYNSTTGCDLLNWPWQVSWLASLG